MFETLFARSGIVGCYRAAPLPDERLGYLEHCARGGTNRRTLRKIAAHQVSLVRLLDLREGERVSVTLNTSSVLSPAATPPVWNGAPGSARSP